MSTFDRSRSPRTERVVEVATNLFRLRRARARRAFRFVWLLFIVPWFIFGHRHSQQHGASAQMPATQEFNPSWYQSSPYHNGYPTTPVVVPVANVSTLTAFQTQLAIGFVNDQARNQWRQQIVGQRVHWTGYVFTPSDGIAPALANSMEPGVPLVHLQTASREAKYKLRQIPDGSKVQVDGVLMDDHWIHVIDVSRMR